MKRTLFLSALVLATMMGLGSCAKEGGVDRGDINGAIKISAAKVTATSACITGECAQSNVVGCYYVKPFETSQAKFVDMDAIDKKAYILEHGVEMTLPLKDSATVQLLAGTSYTAAVIGFDAGKVFRTAPYYTTFTTGTATVSTSASMEESSVYDFIYSIEKGEYTSYVKYIVSVDPSVTSLDGAALKNLIISGGAGVKTARTDIPEEHIISKEKSDFVVAALAYDDLDRPGGMSTASISMEMSVQVTVGASSTKLTRPVAGVDIFTGTVELPATGSFTVNVGGKEYGFTSYSGAGGLGTVNHQFSAIPFHNLTTEMNYRFKVDKALGQMTKIEDGGNAFWLNMDAGAKVNVTIDLTNADGRYRYRFEVPQNDASVVFYEGFDLSVWGGFYQQYIKGTQPSEGNLTTWDGTEAATKDKVSATGMGMDNFCYPSDIELTGSEAHVSDTLMKNWGLQDWTFKKGYLSAGHMRIAASASDPSYTITPKFTALTAPTNVTLTVEAFSFAATVKDVYFQVLGAGSFTKAVVTNTDGYNSTFTVDGTTLQSDKFFPSADMMPKATNATLNKVIATMVLSIEGATADTQIRVATTDTPSSGTKFSDSRFCIDYFKVTK